VTVVLEAPTMTRLPPEARAAVVVSGSHGGSYCGYLAAKAGLRAVILNDAGGGLDNAGAGALAFLERYGIAAATIAHSSARIGDAADMRRRGRISQTNAPARASGVVPGMTCEAAVVALGAVAAREVIPERYPETRRSIDLSGARRRIVLIDSAAQVEPGDVDQVIVTGSHGGLVGGNRRLALQVAGFAAVFNDAGIGIDDAGITRLPALAEQGIAAFTVAARSARIGEAASTYASGIVSVVNTVAAELGARPGLAAKGLIDAWARKAA
jgi:hypothetical protein